MEFNALNCAWDIVCVSHRTVLLLPSPPATPWLDSGQGLRTDTWSKDEVAVGELVGEDAAGQLASQRVDS